MASVVETLFFDGVEALIMRWMREVCEWRWKRERREYPKITLRQAKELVN
jgi:hypothetical protein